MTAFRRDTAGLYGGLIDGSAARGRVKSTIATNYFMKI
jgi:hypothetical protein